MSSRASGPSAYSRFLARFLMIILSLGVAAPTFAASDFNCQVLTAPTLVRAEGMAEQLGDLVLKCTGGTPTPAGQPVPQVNITVLFNAIITSRLVAGSQFSEAVLLVDEPVSPIHPTQSLLNCGNTGAPDNGNLGPGVCSIVSTGNPGSTYDATANGYVAATCDGASGRPGPNSYGCGRPNAFQAQLGTPQSPGQLNAITFFNVPLDPPGESGTRTLRITNVRANVVPLGFTLDHGQSEVVALVTVTGPLPVSLLPSPEAGIATVLPGMTTCQPSMGSRIRICEGFQSSWKPKNISFVTGDHAGTSGNAIANGPFYTFTGTTNYPADVAQNMSGVNYNTESMFEWQNNGANAPPSPDPPSSVSNTTIQATNYPLNSAGTGGLNTGINLDGIANAATRLAVQFLNIPAGASVQVPPVLYLFNGSYNGDPTQYQSGATGVMVLTQTDSFGSGAFSPINTPPTLTPTSNLAVYEILWADPYSLEFAEVPYTILNAPSGTQLQTSVVFAPFYSDSISAQASASAPVPRFENGLCDTLNCVQISPDQAPNTGVSTITFADVFPGTQVKLTGAGLPDIPGTGISDSTDVLSANFDFTGAALGTRDVILTPASGPPITIPGGFTVVAGTCTFAVSPQNSLLPVGGGTAYLDVSEFDPAFFNPIVPTQVPPSRCGPISAASTNTPWITLQPVLPSFPLTQAFSAAPNPNASARTGSITLAGQTVNITQDGTNTCTYSISPGSHAFDPAGESTQVMVTAPAGCAWDFTANAPSWITFTNGSGSGNGTVTIIAAANTGSARTASVVPMPYGSISSFLATQNGAGCSATVGAAGPVSASGGEFIISFSGVTGCSYAAASDVPWITVDSPVVFGSGYADFTAAPNPEPTPRSGTIIVANTTLTIVQMAAGGLQFVPITPCRVVDTRNANGPFGGPPISGGTYRSFTIPSGSCGIPTTALAYSLNVAVVPTGSLGYLTVWPAGQNRPFVATLNSLDGRIKSNAAIVPAGTNGAVSVYATNDTQMILDINGYFVPTSTLGALAFYPVTPCRLVDTRINLLSVGPLIGGASRTLPILSSTCNIPSVAQAYSLNFTVVPPGPVGYLTASPTGVARPLTATLNDLTGTIVANAAIVPAGTGGSIDVYATNNTDLVVDINGYFAPPGTGGLSLYTLPPCRVLDTRQPPVSSTIVGVFDVSAFEGCGATLSAQAYVLNATVVPTGSLGYLTMWQAGNTRPTVATLNALDGAVTNNMAIVSTTNTEISAYATNPTHLILDLFGYFAP